MSKKPHWSLGEDFSLMFLLIKWQNLLMNTESGGHLLADTESGATCYKTLSLLAILLQDTFLSTGGNE
jgi:hypothetical protein